MPGLLGADFAIIFAESVLFCLYSLLYDNFCATLKKV